MPLTPSHTILPSHNASPSTLRTTAHHHIHPRPHAPTPPLPPHPTPPACPQTSTSLFSSSSSSASASTASASSADVQQRRAEKKAAAAAVAAASAKKSPSTNSYKAARTAAQTKEARTIFVGNVPSTAKDKALKKFFKDLVGPVESVRFRSIAVVGTKVGESSYKLMRKAAAITGNIDETRETKNAYVVFRDLKSVDKAVAENGKRERGGRQ